MADVTQIALLIGADYAGTSVEVEIRDDAVWVTRDRDRVVVGCIDRFLDSSPGAQELLAIVQRQDALLILVGKAPPDKLKALVNKGMYDILPAPVEPFRLLMAVRNAFDLQGVRSRAKLSARLVKRNRYELREMIESTRVISSKRNTETLLQTILKKSREITHADAGTVYLVVKKDEGDVLQAKVFENDSIDVDGGEFEVPLTRESLAGQAALDHTVINIPDVRISPPESDSRHHMSVDARTGYHTRSVIMAPMLTQTNEVLGVVQLLNCKLDPFAVLWEPEDFDKNVIPFDSRAVEIVRTLAAHAGVSLETAQLYEDIQRAFDGFVDASVEAIEQRDPTTSGHSNWVTKFTLKLAECVEKTDEGRFADVSFTAEELRELRYAGVLHDFGKIGVPEAVLKKEKKLPEGRLDEIQQRFEAARLSSKLQHLKRLVELTIAGESAHGQREEASTQLQAALDQLERHWDLVVRSNEPTVLEKEREEALDELSKVTYQTALGEKKPLLTEEEHSYLSIRRGSLTKDEFEAIKSHARKTDEFLSKIPWGESLKNIPFIASSHHERLDGSGYPSGLVDEAIPLKAKMMAIADIYDALTASDRPYKKAVPVERALDILRAEARKGGLDSDLVELFVDCRVFDRSTHTDEAWQGSDES